MGGGSGGSMPGVPGGTYPGYDMKKPPEPLWLQRPEAHPISASGFQATIKPFARHLLHRWVIFFSVSESHMEMHSDILVGLGAVEVFGHRFHLCSVPSEEGEELKDFADGLTFAEVNGVADLLVAHITWFFSLFVYSITNSVPNLKVGQINHTDSVSVILTLNACNLDIGRSEDAERDDAGEEREIGDRQKIGVHGHCTDDESGDADDEGDEEEGEGGFGIMAEV